VIGLKFNELFQVSLYPLFVTHLKTCIFITCRSKVLRYFQERVKGAIQIIEKLDLINRTSEFARLFGILFYEVLSRGTQVCTEIVNYSFVLYG